MQKNLVYERHWLSQRGQKVAPIPKRTEMDKYINNKKESHVTCLQSHKKFPRCPQEVPKKSPKSPQKVPKKVRNQAPPCPHSAFVCRVPMSPHVATLDLSTQTLPNCGPSRAPPKTDSSGEKCPNIQSLKHSTQDYQTRAASARGTPPSSSSACAR